MLLLFVIEHILSQELTYLPIIVFVMYLVRRSFTWYPVQLH